MPQLADSVELRLQHHIATEAEEWAGVLPGLPVDVVRTGRGYGPNVATSMIGDQIATASCTVQFPALSRTSIADDRIIVALIASAPRGSRWCGFDLERDSMLLYGPESDHTGYSSPGVSYSFASINIASLEESAASRGAVFQRPKRGVVTDVAGVPGATFLAQALRSLKELSSGRSHDTAQYIHNDIHAAVGLLLSGETAPGRGNGRSVADGRTLVDACVEYVEDACGPSGVAGLCRTPTISELCTAAHASERRLRKAFYDSFGVGPLRYFRFRSLNRARAQLLDAHKLDLSVSEIATGQGFRHFGRFAAYYKDAFGEYPSATMASA